MKQIGVDVSPLSDQKTGVGNYIHYLLHALIVLRPNDRFFLYTFRDLQTLATFQKYPNVFIRKANFLSFSEAIWSQTTLPFLCRKDNLDCFWGTTQSIPFCLKKKTKTVLTIYDFTYKLYPKTVSKGRRWYLKLCGKYIYRKSNSLTTISKGTAERLKQLYNQSENAVIYPPLKTSLHQWKEEDISDLLKSQKLEFNKYLVMLSTLEPRKNVLGTLNAYLTILHKREGKDVYPLLIIGAKGWNDKEIEKRLSKACEMYPLHVRLMGYLDDEVVCKYLCGARYFLMLSLYEGYGMPLAEARVCNTPVICLNVPEMLEAAEHDAHVLSFSNFAKELEPFLLSSSKEEKQPISTSYATNGALASILSAQIDNLI